MARESVLLVSDEKELSRLFSHALERRGLRVQVALSQAEAFRKAGDDGWHSAFLDFDMIGLDPPKLLESLKVADKDVIVLGIVSLGSKARAMDLARLGLSDYLIKPIMADELNFSLDRQEELKGLRSKLATLTSELCRAFPLNDLISRGEGGFNAKLKEFVSILGKLERCNVHELVLKRVEKALLELVLYETKGNKIKAANMLGLNRNTLHRKIGEHDIICKKSRQRRPGPAGELN